MALSTEAFADRGPGLVDWLECLALSQSAEALSRRDLDDLAEAAGVADGDLDLARAALSRREKTWGPVYPFQLIAGGIRAKPGAPAASWTQMLLLSPHVRAQGAASLDMTSQLFEELTMRAVFHFFGAEGRAIEFGFKGILGGRPADFPGAVQWLADQMGLAASGAYRPPKRKDGGVDVVAWRAFPDRRPGFPVLLVQCTVGRELMVKARDVDVRLWSAWLGLDHDPQTALAFPGLVDGRNEWDQLAVLTTVLDRGRLATLLGPPEREDEPPAWVLEQLRQWSGDFA